LFILWYQHSGSRTILLVMRKARKQYRRRRCARGRDRNFALATEAGIFIFISPLKFR
jgi:hypothetical protein